MRVFQLIEDRPNGLPPMERTYLGFSARIGPAALYIAVVEVEDTFEIYSLDTPDISRKALEIFLQDRGYGTIVNVYKRTK